VDVHSALVKRAKELEPDDVQKGLARFFKDGVHFSAEGNKFFYTLLKSALHQHAKQCVPEKMTNIFPVWSDITKLNCNTILGTSSLVDNGLAHV